MLRLLALAAALAVCVAEGTLKVKRTIGDGFKLHSIYELFDKGASINRGRGRPPTRHQLLCV